MSESIEQIIVKEIAKLYASRNITPMSGLIEQWLDDLKMYSPESIYKSFEQVRRHGGAFPSLPEIIAIIEHRTDSDTQAIEAWASVLKAVKASSSKGLTPTEKDTLDTVCGGLSSVMDADSFTRGQIERDFKKVYRAAIEGNSRHVAIPKPSAVEVAKITGDFGKLPFPS